MTKCWIIETVDDSRPRIVDEDLFGRNAGVTSSSPFDSHEAARAACGPDPCRECGGLVYLRYMEPTKTQLVERSLCFGCNFWTGILAGKDGHLFIDGRSYALGTKTTPGSWNGFGGRRFVIEKDGQRIETCDLWTQGDIPKHFRDRLPDNARFVR